MTKDMTFNKLYKLLGRGIKFRSIIDDSYLDLITKLDMTGVTDISYMFEGCNRLSELNLDSWHKGSFVDLSHAFNHCILKNGILDLSKWDLSRVTSLNYTFADNSNDLILPPGFKNEVIEDLYCTFWSNRGIKRLDLSNLNTHNVTNYGWVFGSASVLEWLDISGFDLSNATNVVDFFASNYRLKHLVLGEGFGKIKKGETFVMNSFASLDEESKASFMSLYDRKANGLPNVTLKLNVSYGFTNEQIQALTNKGYIIDLT